MAEPDLEVMGTADFNAFNEPELFDAAADYSLSSPSDDDFVATNFIHPDFIGPAKTNGVRLLRPAAAVIATTELP